jgi:phosphate transport system substrate-binding protein
MNPIRTLALLTALSGPIQAQALQGAGATFPYPLYSKWIAEYQKVDPAVRINYQSIGSGGGIRQILEGTVDFGASDAPMTGAERAKAKSTLHHLPVTLGAVVLTYNVPGVGPGLKLSPEVLAGIYSGEIRSWSDAKITALNGGVKLPPAAITVAYRSDGSGTTAVFTEYLAKVSGSWQKKVGAGKSVRFPVGLGAKGNEGVTGLVKTTPGAIGYVELAYAKQNGMHMAAIRNQAGKFIDPAPEGVSAAAAGHALPQDLCLSLVDAPSPKAYPISSFSYILFYEHQADPAKGKALASYLWWAIHEGQKFSPALDYAPLPKDLVPALEARVKRIQSGGRLLLANR